MNSVLIMLASKLSDLITKTSEEYVSAKMSEAKATNDFNKALPIYSELINKLLNDKQEAITVASQYRAELDKTFLPDTDIKYLETTFSKLIKLFEKFDSKESPTFTSEIVEQINGLVNTETLKSMQLLGFDFKSAIGLIEFVADARRHGPQRRQLAGLYQIILGAHQFLLGVFALQHFLFEPPVQAFQIAGPFDHAHLQLAAGLGFEGDTFQVVATALHQQAQQQHQHQQRGAAHGNHRAHRAADQGLRREDFHVPAGLGNRRGLAQPRRGAEGQRLRVAGRVGLDGDDRLALFGGQRAGRTEAPLRA